MVVAEAAVGRRPDAVVTAQATGPGAARAGSVLGAGIDWSPKPSARTTAPFSMEVGAGVVVPHPQALAHGPVLDLPRSATVPLAAAAEVELDLAAGRLLDLDPPQSRARRTPG